MRNKKIIKSNDDWVDDDWADDNTCGQCEELIDVGCRCYESKSYLQSCNKCGLSPAECNCDWV